MSIFPSLFAEFWKNLLQVAAMFVEKFRKNRAIFEAGIHSLPIEWNLQSSFQS
jgi:hypothetical protein